MSGRTQMPIRHPTRAPKFLLVLGLLVGMALLAVAVPEVAAQEDRDPKSPLPPIQTKRSIAIDRNKAIFLGRLDKSGNRIRNTGINDNGPIATEEENSDEYQAWTAVVQHARQFTQAEIEEGARRDLTRDDLVMVTDPLFPDRRLAPVRFEGKLTRVRRVEASRGLKLEGTAELYEALLVPIDEPMPADWEKSLDYSVCVVFTELPEALASVKEKPVDGWMEVNAWARVAGFFFKVRKETPEDPALPVLVGKSVTMLPGEPFAPGPNPAALDPDLRVFRMIRNDEALARGHNNWEEGSAWNRVLLHARRFSKDDLEKYAGEVSFATLFRDGKRELELTPGKKSFDYKGHRDYKLDLVKFEGQLVMLTPIKPSAKLRAAGIETVYEGWLVPKDEPSNNPICIMFTDPVEGVEPKGSVNAWGTFAGYSFKLLRYESQERDEANKAIVKRAPLLMGRAFIPRPDRRVVSWADFATAATAVVVGLVAFALGATWWFRRGDRRARREIEIHRSRNPFSEQPT